MIETTKMMLSVNEFCAEAGIGRVTFYKELKSGRIHAKKCGSRTLVPRSELLAWIERLPDAGAS